MKLAQKLLLPLELLLLVDLLLLELLLLLLYVFITEFFFKSIGYHCVKSGTNS